MKEVRGILVWVLCKGGMKANCLDMKGGIVNSEQLPEHTGFLWKLYKDTSAGRTNIKRIILKGALLLGLTQLWARATQGGGKQNISDILVPCAHQPDILFQIMICTLTPHTGAQSKSRQIKEKEYHSIMDQFFLKDPRTEQQFQLCLRAL